jgi:hypothetical protein
LKNTSNKEDHFRSHNLCNKGTYAFLISTWGMDAINAFADGDDARMMLMGLKRFTKTENFNSKEALQLIA